MITQFPNYIKHFPIAKYKCHREGELFLRCRICHSPLIFDQYCPGCSSDIKPLVIYDYKFAYYQRFFERRRIQQEKFNKEAHRKWLEYFYPIEWFISSSHDAFMDIEFIPAGYKLYHWPAWYDE